MTNRRFPIFGTTVPPMLGRTDIINRMKGSLTKATPDHLQVVGPPFVGKTVILNELAKQLSELESPYSAVRVWDLGHQTPNSDERFMQEFAKQLADALSTKHPDYSQHLRGIEGNPYQDISEVLDLLKDENGKILLFMDGFDKPLSNGQLTRNLWDQLREIAQKPSLRLVTASRKTLSDLIRSPDVQTSDFWNIFDPTPVRVGCFNDEDLNAVLGCLPNLGLSPGARTELLNASNGFPIITLEILNKLCEDGYDSVASDATMRAASDTAFSTLRDSLNMLWEDCPPSAQDLMRRILVDGALKRGGISSADVNTLVERGFALVVSNKLQRPNSLLAKYLEELPNEGNALVRLFSSNDNYRKNFKGILERRIMQINELDPDLKRFLERAAGDLPDHPNVFMTNIRGIVDRAFELIWKAELGDKKLIPPGWMSVWKRNNERGVDEWETTFPQGVRRLRLINLMTGTDKSQPCAKYITRDINALMNAAHSFGDLGQHLEGTVISTELAYSVLGLCVELAAALTQKLPK